MVERVVLAFIVTPIVVHLCTFDLANGSAASALIVGISGAAIALWIHSWEIALLIFFLASFVQFALAYVVGMVIHFFGSAQRSSFSERASASPISHRRLFIGGIGAVAISVAVFVGAAVIRIQTGVWPDMPLRPLLGLVAFFILGAVSLVTIEWRRRKRQIHTQSTAKT
jgi:hypothetical protein